MTEYSHFARSAVCASLGLYVGPKDSEVKIADASGNVYANAIKIADTSGYLYSGGTQVAGASGRLYQAGNVLTKSTTGGMYAGLAPTVSDGSLRISGGTFSCSAHASLDTGLTVVYGAVCQIVGRIISGKVATLDRIATPDTTPNGISGHPTYIQHRIRSSKYLRVRTYCRNFAQPATLNNATKRCLISWIAIGT